MSTATTWRNRPPGSADLVNVEPQLACTSAESAQLAPALTLTAARRAFRFEGDIAEVAGGGQTLQSVNLNQFGRVSWEHATFP